ncbi:MAG: hypothetical protein IJY26_03440 [Clostridia bacterium]|nr:hypothetical protein [Clostridia bacterium]
MKKLKLIVTSLLMGILLFALASCGGASGVVGSFIGAVKSGDYEKAATYVVGGDVDGKYDEDNEVEAYIYKKTVGSFSYKVEGTTENTNDEGEVTSVEVRISYTKYSQVALRAELLKNTSLGDILGGANYTKEDVDTALKALEKASNTATVIVQKTEEVDWKISTLSAAALVVAMVA